MTKKCFPETTGTLKKSIPDDPVERALRVREYLLAHDYKDCDKEFPEPLEGHGIFEETECNHLLRSRLIWFNNVIKKRLKK